MHIGTDRHRHTYIVFKQLKRLGMVAPAKHMRGREDSCEFEASQGLKGDPMKTNNQSIKVMLTLAAPSVG